MPQDPRVQSVEEMKQAAQWIFGDSDEVRYQKAFAAERERVRKETEDRAIRLKKYIKILVSILAEHGDIPCVIECGCCRETASSKPKVSDDGRVVRLR